MPIGDPTIPEITYGFGISSGFKGFDISVFFQGLTRESFWIDANATAPFINYDNPNAAGNSTNNGFIGENALLKAYADSHWSEENRDLYAIWPRLSTTPNVNNSVSSTWFMRDGSFLRLKEAEIGYTVPRKFTSRHKIQNIRIYISGRNLVTWSKFKLWDPEMGGNGLGYPVQRIYNGGIQLNF